MNIISETIKKIFSYILKFSLLFVFSGGSFLYAHHDNNKNTHVKVGWYYSSMFQEGMSDSERKTGYSYEYLQGISDYNGWVFEYVYGEWADLLEKLENGEIDILAGVSITEERKEKLLFPSYVMGTDKYYLYQHDNKRSMNPDDLSTFNGKKIGGVRNNRMTFFLEQWAEENNVDFDVVYYDGFIERDKDFSEYKLDGISATDNNIKADSGYAAVVKVGEEPFYLAVTKSKPEILKQLNYSLGVMEEMDPYFQQNLLYSSYGSTLTTKTLTTQEKEWLNSHKNMRIGYMENYLPYCKTDRNGRVKGLVVDVLNAAFYQLGIRNEIQFDYIPFENYEDMLSALRNNHIDCAFPVGGGEWNVEKDGVDVTTSVVEASMDLVYKGNYKEDKFKIISVNENNKLQYYYVTSHFRDSIILSCNSINECIEAVASERADATIVNGLRIDLVRNNSRYDNLSILQLQETDSRSFGVANGNSALLLLLNRGIKVIGHSYGINASYSYVDELYASTLLDFLREHLGIILLIVAIFFGSILAILLLYVRSIKKAQKKFKVQLEENRRLMEKAEVANKAKTAFLFNMSHDIRTPMNAIIGFSDLIGKNLDSQEKCLDYLQKIKYSSNFLLSLINNVLEMSRIESGSAVVDEKSTCVKDFSASLCAVFEEQMKAKKIEFINDSKTDIEYIYLDQVKVRQIFLNIISNSLKYTPEGGHIKMHTDVEQSVRKGFVTFRTTITDDGIGMHKDFPVKKLLQKIRLKEQDWECLLLRSLLFCLVEQ